MDTFVIVEKLTQGLTVIALASGIPPCIHMIKTGITKNVPFIFFFLGMMNGVVGTIYGLMISNATLLYINLLAMIMSAVVVVSYIAMTKSKSKPMLQVLFGSIFLLLNHWYCVRIVVHEGQVTEQYGLMMFFISLVLLASPALEVMECMKDKSAEGMSVAMIVGNLSCSFAWLFYGILLKDFFVYAPNIVGVATNLGKAVVKVIYGGKKDKTA
ncbi:sugar transporter SWEET1-like [Mytilus galloprovincialis]|uniref:sugar transporter SWEET1-like n=1 Tax=Mytilus galloprovincialis TaxID=29158 RepID=UPI003F7BAA2A